MIADIPKIKTDKNSMLNVNFQTCMSEFIPRRGVLQDDVSQVKCQSPVV